MWCSVCSLGTLHSARTSFPYDAIQRSLTWRISSSCWVVYSVHTGDIGGLLNARFANTENTAKRLSEHDVVRAIVKLFMQLPLQAAGARQPVPNVSYAALFKIAAFAYKEFTPLE